MAQPTSLLGSALNEVSSSYSQGTYFGPHESGLSAIVSPAPSSPATIYGVIGFPMCPYDTYFLLADYPIERQYGLFCV
jgi:hypothetical protein